MNPRLRLRCESWSPAFRRQQTKGSGYSQGCGSRLKAGLQRLNTGYHHLLSGGLHPACGGLPYPNAPHVTAIGGIPRGSLSATILLSRGLRALARISPARPLPLDMKRKRKSPPVPSPAPDPAGPTPKPLHDRAAALADGLRSLHREGDIRDREYARQMQEITREGTDS